MEFEKKTNMQQSSCNANCKEDFLTRVEDWGTGCGEAEPDEVGLNFGDALIESVAETGIGEAAAEFSEIPLSDVQSICEGEDCDLGSGSK